MRSTSIHMVISFTPWVVLKFLPQGASPFPLQWPSYHRQWKHWARVATELWRPEPGVNCPQYNLWWGPGASVLLNAASFLSLEVGRGSRWGLPVSSITSSTCFPTFRRWERAAMWARLSILVPMASPFSALHHRSRTLPLLPQTPFCTGRRKGALRVMPRVGSQGWDSTLDFALSLVLLVCCDS